MQALSIICGTQPKIALGPCSLFPFAAPSIRPSTSNTALWRPSANRAAALQLPHISPFFWHFAYQFMVV